jgi:hypothetical protein
MTQEWRGGEGQLTNKVAKTTWIAVAILVTIILIAFIMTRGGQ